MSGTKPACGRILEYLSGVFDIVGQREGHGNNAAKAEKFNTVGLELQYHVRSLLPVIPQAPPCTQCLGYYCPQHEAQNEFNSLSHLWSWLRAAHRPEVDFASPWIALS